MKEPEKVRYVYLTNYLTRTVTDSQVISWLQLLQSKGYSFELVILSGLKPFFKNRKILKTKIKNASKILYGKVRHMVSIKASNNLGQFSVLFLMIVLLFKNYYKGEKILVQTRTSEHLLALSFLKKIYPKIKIIFDSRGAIAEEELLTKTSGRYCLNDETRQGYKQMLKREINFALLADSVFCVSNKLKQYFLKKCKRLNPKKIIVVPGCADEETFYYDLRSRDKLRKELCVDNKFVLVYSGGLNKAWQIPDYLFNITSQLFCRYPELVLLCLTPHVGIVTSYIEKYNFDTNRIINLFVKYDELRKYLNAADAGILFREDTPTNNVASPTKFAEYIMCGLPILISENIGDFSNLTIKENLGVTLKYDAQTIKVESVKKIIEKPINKYYIAQRGKDLLSKQKHIKKIINTYNQLIL